MIRNLPSADVERMDEPMEKYADTPMDLADSSLVATAEAQEIRTIFTSDGHFPIYRLRSGGVLRMVP